MQALTNKNQTLSLILCGDANYEKIARTLDNRLRIFTGKEFKLPDSCEMGAEINLIFDNYAQAKPVIAMLSSLFKVNKFDYNGHRIFSLSEVNALERKRVFFIAMPKSGSVWVWTHLQNVLLTKAIKSFGGTWAEPGGQKTSIPSMRQFIRERQLSSSHLHPSEFNISLIKQSLVVNPDIRFILHLRDPRQALLSWIKFQPKVDEWLQLSLNHSDSPIEHERGSFDYFFESFYLRMVDYVHNWLRLIDKNALSNHFLITTHEELSEAPARLNEKLAQWVGVDPDDLKLDEKPTKNAQNYRRGQVNEWREHFSTEQIERLNQAMPGTILERLGWERS